MKILAAQQIRNKNYAAEFLIARNECRGAAIKNIPSKTAPYANQLSIESSSLIM